MNRIHLLVPLFATTLFAGYYHHWNNAQGGCDLPAQSAVRRSRLDPYDNRDGRREAEADFAAGNLVILTYGMPVAWSLEYRDTLRRYHGIEVKAVAGCVVSDGLVRYVEAYNKVMEPHITRVISKHGLNEALRQAEERYHEQASAEASARK